MTERENSMLIDMKTPQSVDVDQENPNNETDDDDDENDDDSTDFAIDDNPTDKKGKISFLLVLFRCLE